MNPLWYNGKHCIGEDFSMSEIVTYDDEQEALKWEPERVGQAWGLYQNMYTGKYQWANSQTFAHLTGLVGMYPELETVSAGFGRSSFGLAPFGS